MLTPSAATSNSILSRLALITLAAFALLAASGLMAQTASAAGTARVFLEVKCSSTQVPVGQTTSCNVRASHELLPPNTNLPSGIVTFTDSRGTGVFTNNPCMLRPSPSGPFESNCEVGFSSATAGGRTIQASYPGDDIHEAATAATQVKVIVPGAIRFAAPGGTGLDPCTNRANPCSLFNAASSEAPGTSVVPGSEVVLAPGKYTKADLGNRAGISLESGITFRGEAGAPRPLIELDNGVFASDAKISHVEIDSKAGPAIFARTSVVDEVVARTSAPNATTCSIESGVLRDTACLSSGSGAAAAGGSAFTERAESFQLRFRNVTAVSTGPESVGMRFRIESLGLGGGELNADVSSVIAEGTKVDVQANSPTFAGTPVADVRVALDHSNYASIEPPNPTANISITSPGDVSRGNITAPPLLAGDNIHQTFSSPTIDKGVTDAFSGVIDIDGEARKQGPAPDIGADEIPPPNTTETKLSCQAATVFSGEATTCTATVTDKGDNSPARDLTGGTVTFKDNTQATGSLTPTTCTLVGISPTQASCQTGVEFKSTTLGNHALEASFATDGKGHSGSIGTLGVEVKPLPNTTETELTCKAPSLIAGESTKCTATVTDNADNNPASPLAGGTVTFEDDIEAGAFSPPATCTLVRKNATQAVCQVEVDFKPNTVAIHTLKASYPGDNGKHAPSVSPTVNLTVNAPLQPNSTKTELSCKAPSMFSGETTKCDATVTDKVDNGPPVSLEGALVTFTDRVEPAAFPQPASCRLVRINATQASCEFEVDFRPNTVAKHALEASYPGDAAHTGSTGTLEIQVNPQRNDTETKLTCRATPLIAGESTKCTAEVADRANNRPGSPLGGGTVTFKDNTQEDAISPTTCTLANLTNTTATCQIEVDFKPTVIGNHVLEATFEGDAAHAPSSKTLTVPVRARPNTTETKLRCQVESLITGESTHCTATVTDKADNGVPTPPSGTVSFKDNTQAGTFTPASCQLQTTGANVASCQAEVEFKPTTVANHRLEASYLGDTAHLTSFDAPGFQVNIKPNTTSTDLTCRATTLISGGTTTCTATVTDNSDNNPASSLAGAVVNFNDTTQPGTFTPTTCTLERISNTQGRCQTEVEFKPTTVGRHTIEAAFPGDGGAHASSVKSIPIQVNAQPNDTETELTCRAATFTTGVSTKCTATVIDTGNNGVPSSAGGTVTFEDEAEDGSFTPVTCTLEPRGATRATCQTEVDFKPTVAGEHLLRASYPGDGDKHAASAGTLAADVEAVQLPPVLRPTKTTLVCAPASLVLGAGASQCTATVEDTAAGATHPDGEVKLEIVSGEGTLAAKSCNLPANGQAKVSCQVVAYTPGKAGDHELKASYQGDPTHAQSSGTAKVTVTAPPSVVVVPPPVAPLPPVAPDTTLAKKPSKRTAGKVATFKFSSNQAGATFQCKVDKKAFKACTSPFKVKVKNGAHTFTVKAVSAQGVADPTPVVYKWTVGPVKARPKR